MVNIPHLTAYATFLLRVCAVNVNFYQINDLSCKTWVAGCTNLAEDTCCTNKVQWASSAKYTSYPNSARWIGTVFEPTSDNNGCGRGCDSLTGVQSACLNCGSDTLITGASWHLTGGKREADKDCTEVLVDKAVIDNRVFEVNYNVPQNDTDTILTLAYNGATFADVPEYLLQYEAVGV
ncbi:hypothetical protein EK21DRAFT_110299 [Setomelanomma holmii]|uniref:Uncharacterized protein n=1 Tax=Setomelanomma holmii TaxID=210430 RepID=A0A9P4HEH0_9PLEO|nr:hypothetical protein EK21DRAFT_110299 [Setomelanomma holmii]